MWACLFCSRRKDLVRGHVHGKFFDATFGVQNAKISNGRLPPEDGSDRPQTLPKRVSDDSPRFIFRHHKFFQNMFFSPKNLDFTNLSFWRSSDFFIRVGRCVVKSYCPNCPYFWGDFLGEGVKVVKRVFWLGFGPKMTLITSSCDVMIV